MDVIHLSLSQGLAKKSEYFGTAAITISQHVLAHHLFIYSSHTMVMVLIFLILLFLVLGLALNISSIFNASELTHERIHILLNVRAMLIGNAWLVGHFMNNSSELNK